MKLRETPRTLDAILTEDDELGLLEGVRPLASHTVEREDPAETGFRAIQDFCREHGREPSEDDPAERTLAMRLRACRTRPELRAKLLPLDDCGLLAAQEEQRKEVTSLDDILADEDDMGLFDDVDPSIIGNEPSPKAQSPSGPRDMPDFIASRKPCEDFYRYENFFRSVQMVLHRKEVMLRRVPQETAITLGQVYIVKGMLCYIDCILDTDSSAQANNPRLRIIFQNGTETDMLKGSFSKALYKDKQSKLVDFNPNLFANGSLTITPKDVPTGHIYILATENRDPALAQWRDARKLVKIGYTAGSVEERIRNAPDDPTYLEAPVKVLAVIDCYNLNPQKFEHLTHAFLNSQRLGVNLISRNGQVYRPREWFTVDKETAVEVCKHIVDGDIHLYRMDNTRGRIVKKQQAE